MPEWLICNGCKTFVILFIRQTWHLKGKPWKADKSEELLMLFVCLSIRFIKSNCVHGAVLSHPATLVWMIFYISADCYALCLSFMSVDQRQCSHPARTSCHFWLTNPDILFSHKYGVTTKIQFQFPENVPRKVLYIGFVSKMHHNNQNCRL